MKKVLIAYFSWSNGNTERIAKMLQEAVGGDLLRLETAAPYSGDYDTVVQQGKEEVERGYEPELKPGGKNPEDYDVIAVGTPTWWYTMAPAVLSFLHGHKWQGKTFIPFMTNAGWPGHVIKDMEKACPGANLRCPMEIKFDADGGSFLETSTAELDKWLQSIRRELEK